MKRWIDDVEEDLRNMGIRKFKKTMQQERLNGEIIEESKTHIGFVTPVEEEEAL